MNQTISAETSVASPPSPRAWILAVGLIAVLALAGALRFWNISAGLPYRIGVDEPVIADQAIRMMRTGDFNPHFYDYPGLSIYIQLATGIVRFMTGSMAGLYRTVDEFYPEHLFPWTRALSGFF